MHLRRIGLGVVVSCAPAWVGCTAILGSDFKDGPLEDGSVASEDGSTHDDAGKKDSGSDAKTDAKADAKSDATSDAAKDAQKDAPGVDAPGEKTLTVDVVGAGLVKSVDGKVSCGEGDTQCTDSVLLGKSVILSATPGDGGTFGGWSGGGCTGTGNCVVKLEAAVTVTANFTTEPLLTVAADGSGAGTITSSVGGIDCGAVDGGVGTCSAVYATGTIVTLTAAASSLSAFSGWTTGPCTGTASTCQVTVDSSTTVGATFNADDVLTVAVTGVGTVESSDGTIDCPVGLCTFDYGQTAATPKVYEYPTTGNIFTGWSGGCAGLNQSCALDVDQPTSVGASFVPSSVWDPTFGLTGGVYTSGDLGIAILSTATNVVNFRSTIGRTAGKWYWEITANNGVATTDGGGLGIIGSDFPSNASYIGAAASGTSFGYGGADLYYSDWADSNVKIPTTTAPTTSAIAKGSIYMFALDMDGGNFWAGVNGTWFGGGNPSTGTTPVITGLTGLTIYAGATLYESSADQFTANFGGTNSFSYVVPTGFYRGM